MVSPDFAKFRFYTDAFMNEIYPDTNTDDNNSPNVI